ncbi:MAG: hypothetical protein NC131_00690 [Roseburia sp.]|nr:hypothetical protein [Roseburia sp.]
MISYDNYKNRIEKMAKVKRGLHKFRFLIAGVLALIVGTSVGLMCAKGSYTSGMSLSAQTVRFNEPYTVNAAKAFLASPSEQHIEYSLAGSGEWTTQKPVKAGSYQARTVTKKLVGYSYSPSVNFEILPIDAEFTILSSSVVYGNTPEFAVSSLVSWHKVDESALKFSYADYSARTTEVSAVESSLKITDEGGEDYTGCYNVTFTPKTLSIRNRSLTASPLTYEFTYDGGGHACTNEVSPETLSGLANGDEIAVEAALYNNVGARVDGVVNAGVYSVRLVTDSVKIMHGGVDVTSHYNLNLTPSQLIVNRRKLTITTQSGEKTYDGLPFVKTEVQSENLVEGHTVSADGSTIPDAENTGTYENVFGVFVLDGLSDVTNNYEVEVNAGTLTITPCKISVTTPNAEKTYDGKPLFNDNFKISEPPAGFNFAAATYATVTDYGTKPNEIGLKITKKSDGSDVTGNFEIDYTNGTLKVEKRAMAVTTGSLGVTETAVYNGEPQFNALPASFTEATEDSTVGLLTSLGHELTVDDLFTVTDVTATGGADNVTAYAVWGGGRNLTENYAISYTYGKIIIAPRHVNVVTSTPAAHEYDGKAFSDTGYTTDIAGGGLYNGDTLVLVGKAAEITEEGTVTNKNEFAAPNGNYVIDGITYGELTVKPKAVKVIINNSAAAYGNAIPDNGFTLDCGELPNGETLTFTTHYEMGGVICTPEKWEHKGATYTLLNAGGYSIVQNANASITGGNANLRNYDFSFAFGSLEITARNITVTTATASHVYDGKSFSDTAYTTAYADGEGEGLLNGDVLTVNSFMTVRTIDDIPTQNVVTYAVPNQNYRIAGYTYGTLNIIPRPVIVYTDDDYKVYDGSELYNEGYTVKFAVQSADKTEWVADETEAGLISGDGLSLVGKHVSITDAGETPNANKFENANYSIKGYVNGTLKIDRKTVEIKLETQYTYYGNEEVYGEAKDFGTGYTRKDGLSAKPVADDEILYVKIGYRQNGAVVEKEILDGGNLWRLSAGTYQTYAQEFYLISVDAPSDIIESGATLKNYDISCADGSLTVYPRHVTVNIGNGTAVYGEDVSDKEYSLDLEVFRDETHLPYGEQLSLTFKYDRAVVNVGDYYVLQDGVFIDETKVDPDNCNYDFTFNAGTLTVTAKKIRINMTDSSCEYGEALPDIDWWFEDKDGAKITEFPFGDTVELVGFYYHSMTTGAFCGWHDSSPRLDADTYSIDYNTVSCRNPDGEDCRGNYNPVIVYLGILTVRQAPLSITLPQITGLTYGDEYSYPADKQVITGLKYNQKLTFDIIYTDSEGNAVDAPKDKGAYTISPDESTYAIENEDETEGLITNYKLSVTNGSVTINPFELAVKFTEEYCDYVFFRLEYGDEIPDPEYVLYDYARGNEDDADGFKLPYSEKIRFGYRYLNLETKNYETPKNAGIYELYISYLYVNEILQTNASTNYNIHAVGGALPWINIQKKIVKPTLNDFSKVYGDYLSNEFSPTAKYDEEGNEYLAYGEDVLIVVKYLKDGKEVTPQNVGEYDIEIAQYIILGEDGNEIAGGENNYEFIPTCGKLTVTPRPITITLRDREITYGDKLEFTNPLFADVEGVTHDENGKYVMPYGDSFVVGFLVGGERYVSSVIYSAGTHVISQYMYGIQRSGETGNEVVPNENYDITWIDGTLTVKPRTVLAVIDTDNTTEYGKAPEDSGFEIYLEGGGAYTLPDNDTLTLTYGYYAYGDGDKTLITPKNKGEYGITAVSAAINGVLATEITEGENKGGFAVGNYIVKAVNGKLTVTPKKVTVVLNDIPTVTYGEKLAYAAGVNNYANYETIGLEYGEKLEVAVEYLIDGEPGTPVNVNYEDYSDRYHFAYSARLKDAACKVYESDGLTVIENGEDNYVFECETLEDLKIIRSHIRIYINDILNLPYGDEVVYPDELENYKRVEHNVGESYVEGVPYGEKFKVGVIYLDESGKKEVIPKNAGTYKIILYSIEVYDKDGEYIRYGNNNYTYATVAPYQGTLTIVQREVKITLNSYEKVYGEFRIDGYGTFAYPQGTDNYNLAKSDKLAYGERLSVEVKYQQNGVDVTPKNVGVYNISAVDYTIYDGEDEADKNNYRVSYVAGELEITQKELAIIITSVSVKYGGKVPSAGYYAISGSSVISTKNLPYGDSFTPTFEYYVSGDGVKTPVTPRNAGTYGITLAGAEINSQPVGIASEEGNYYITASDGTLTISKAEIELTLNDLDDVYYGKIPVYASGADNYDTENSTTLADGDKLEVAVSIVNYGATDNNASEWCCGEYTIELDEGGSLIYYNGETMPLITNYTVTGVTEGHVKIERRKVAVNFIGRSFVYGDKEQTEKVGNEHFTFRVDISDDTEGTLSETELPYGETLTFANTYLSGGVTKTAHNAGTYYIRPGTVYINGIAVEEGKGNYAFTYNQNATLTIDKKPVNITLSDIRWYYGEYCTVNEDGTYTIELPETGEFKNTDGTNKEILAYGEQLYVSVNFTEVGKEDTTDFISPKNVGNYSVVATGYTVISYENGVYEGGQESGAGDGLTNYTVTCESGALEIRKRPITVAIPSDLSSVYGTALPAIEPVISSEGYVFALPYGEKIEVTYHFEDEKGKTYTSANPPQNAGTYKIVSESAAVDGGKGDGSYEITTADGLLEISAMPIFVTVHGGECTYGYEKLPEFGLDIVTVNGIEYTLPNGEKLVPYYIFGINGEWTATPVNADVYDISVDEDKCAVTGGNALYENYNVEYTFEGKLTVNKMALTVTIGSAEITYGEELPEIPYTVTSGGKKVEKLPHNDVLALTFTFTSAEVGYTGAEPTAAGVYAITATAGITGGNGRIGNYNVTYASAEPEKQPALTINQREIEITLNIGGNLAFTYGDDFNSAITTAQVKGGVEGHTFAVAVTYAQVSEEAEGANLARAFATRARLSALRNAEFMPKDKGIYVASLALDTCTVTDGNGAVAGGIDNYKLKEGFICKDVRFEIMPMRLNVTVNNATAVYGDKLPQINYGVAEEKAGTMPGGETLALTFKYASAPKHVGSYDILVDTESITGGKISNYILTYINKKPRLTITEKPVLIKASDISAAFNAPFVYEIENGNYDVENSYELAEGDVLKITEVKFVDKNGNEVTAGADVGEYTVEFISYDIVNADNESAYGDYRVTRKNGTLKISGNVIVIFTGSDEKEYDGENLYCEAFTYSGTLAEGYSIQTDEKFGVKYVTEAGGVDNKTTFKVVDAAGNKSGNYLISYGNNGKTYGKLKITPRPVEIVSDKATREYNGAELTAGYSVIYRGVNTGAPAIAPADTFKGATSGITDAGSKANSVTFTIEDGEGNDVSANYTITRNFGILTVTRKVISVTVKISTAVYGVAPEISFVSDKPLVEGENLGFGLTYRDKSSQVYTQEDILPVGDYRAYYVADSATVNGDKAKAQNYTFSFALGVQFKVTERHIKVTTPTPEAHEYDGAAFFDYSDYQTEWYVDGEAQGVSGLVGTDTLTVQTYASITNVGTAINACTYTAGANYVIDGYINGTLTVTERVLAIATDDVTEMYDGKPHSDGRLIYNENRLISGHTLTLVGTPVAVTDVTLGVENRLTDADVKIEDAEGNDVSANYALSWTYGKIIINKRALAITTGSSLNNVYDGQPHGNPDEASVGATLIEGHRVELLKEFTYTNATSAAGVDNKTEYKVLDGNNGDKDVSANYGINYTYGKIVVSKATVTVTLKENVSAEYGADYAEFLSENAVTLVNGETAVLKIDYNRTVSGIGGYKATVDWSGSVILDENGEQIDCGTDNYNAVLSPVWRDFTVVARKVTVTLNADGKTEFVYGDDYDKAIRNIKTSRSIDGEVIKVSVIYRQNGVEILPEDVGDYTAELASYTVEGGDENNYDVSCGIAAFKITPKKLTVRTADLTVAFGSPLVYPEGVKGYVSVEGLLNGHDIKVTPAFERDGEAVEPEYAGKYDIICGGITVNGGAVKAENYAVETAKPYGVLTIEGINILIERKTVDKVYDGEKLSLSVNAPASEVIYYVNGVEGAPLETGVKLVLDGEFATQDGNVSSSRANTAAYKAVYENGEAAKNYVITYAENDAKLEIKQRVVDIETDTASRAYNGAPLTAGCEIVEGELVSGHVLSYKNQASITDKGSKDNTMVIVIKDAAGAEVTENYDLSGITYGTLTVTELTLNVVISDINKVYGEDINVNNFLMEAELIAGETLYFLVKYTTDGTTFYDGSDYLDVGSYTIVADTENMSVSGGRGKTSNYIFNFTADASLNISQRHIKITTPTPDDREYDGNAFFNYTDYDTEWYVDGKAQGVAGLVGGDTLTMLTYSSITEVGDRENICTYSVSTNYCIDGYINGTLTVVGRTIAVSTNDIKGTYNGGGYFDEGFTCEENKLLTGHKISVTDKTVQTDACPEGVENVLEFKISDADGNDVTACYDIQPEYGTIIIERATLTVTLNVDTNGVAGRTEYAYGDASFDAAFSEFKAEGLVHGESLAISLIYDTADGLPPVNAGEYEVSLDTDGCTLSGREDGAGLENYDVTCNAVAFTIAPKDITATLGAWASEEYNGGGHEYGAEKFSLPQNALITGEYVSNVSVRYCSDEEGENETGTPVNAGTYYVFLDTEATTVADGNGVENPISANYNVTCAYITFTVTPKKLVVTLSDVTHVYDGEEFDFTSSEGFATNLCEGDEIECNVTYSATPVDKGVYTVTFDTDIVFTSGNADNYVFDGLSSRTECKLTIGQREITVTVADLDVEKGKDIYGWNEITSETADGEEGFIASDIENGRITVKFIKTYDDENQTSGTVTAQFGGEAAENYIIHVVDGSLKITERRVLVTPVYNGETPVIYSGEGVDISDFGYTHVHNIDNCGEDDAFGFAPEHEGAFTATYSFVDKKTGKKVSGTPKNAGLYEVSVTLSGEGINSYLITYETLTFEIERKPLSYTTVITGDTEFTYSGECPEFTAEITEGKDGIPEGSTFKLFGKDNKPATRYDVGEYAVCATFAGIENYEITVKSDKLTIIPRVLVITPTDPYNGEAQVYNGHDLTLGATNFAIVYGECAARDIITVTGTSLAPTASSGDIKIASVNIVDRYDPAISTGGNYTVYSVYNANNAIIGGLGLKAINFQIHAEYAKTPVHYTIGNVFGVDTGSFPYTGSSFTYTFDGGEIYLSDGQQLNFGHYITVLRNTVTVSAAAGEYPTLITKLVRIYNAEGKNVTPVYELICDNPEAGLITVTENVLTPDLSGVNLSELSSGDKIGCAVSGLHEGATPAHTAEVYAFDIDGEWIIGVTVFSTNAAGKKSDLSSNYKLADGVALSGATVKLITLEEAEIYSRPAIGVEINVTAAQLAGGMGSIYSEDESGRWVLGGDYYEVSGTLLSGHALQVLVFTEDDGYVLGVTVYSQNGGRRIEAKGNYRLRDIVLADNSVAARYITVNSASDMQRELYIDLSGAFNADGTPVLKDGMLDGYTVMGLNTGDAHGIEISCTDNGDGTYSLSVTVYQYRLQGTTQKKYNKCRVYKLVCTPPANVTVTLNAGLL